MPLQPGPAEQPPLVPPNVKPMSPTLRVLLVAVGIVVFTIGAIIWISPAPGGFIFLAVGLSLILANSKLAKRRFLTWKRRYPQVLMPLRHLLRRFGGGRSRR